MGGGRVPGLSGCGGNIPTLRAPQAGGRSDLQHADKRPEDGLAKAKRHHSSFTFTASLSLRSLSEHKQGYSYMLYIQRLPLLWHRTACIDILERSSKRQEKKPANMVNYASMRGRRAAGYSKCSPLRSPAFKKLLRGFGPRACKKRGCVFGRARPRKKHYAKKRLWWSQAPTPKQKIRSIHRQARHAACWPRRLLRIRARCPEAPRPCACGACCPM
jgi:hypothetical protein